VELRGFEPLLLPAEIRFELPVRSVSVRLTPARYLRFRSRVLTASRVVVTPYQGMSPGYAAPLSSDDPWLLPST
jgi:hypothetical protein